ncbi:MAG: 6,7-dimethyl-8-ribityllumazine synthase, partial [Acidobacteria bacterium]|nr:6,7-dimethyl-8-ribityllumazine synthase [Acidobacteriota bacterium]
MKELVGKLDSKGLKIGIVVARFNEMITQRLLTGALETLGRNGVSEDDIIVVRVPGSF